MMTPTPRQKRAAPKTNTGINGLIAVCNKHDRFKLLEDDTISPGDLDNPIHCVFSKLRCERPMKQTLQLASHFLTHDTLLSFFVPLLYGRELRSTVNGTYKTYLSNPLDGASTEKHRLYLSGVRDALECLSHSLSFQFVPPLKRVYARTLIDDAPPTQDIECCCPFQRKYSCKIELADFFQSYYTSGEYAGASRCAQFRHDFLLATTLVHEIVHAVGVLRRGNLDEPHIRADHPETEWGYGWEHFMFGCIINPQDKCKPGTHLLMRKVWVDPQVADDAGGKEYSDVPMSYVAHWFRRKTWSVIHKQGPTAIAAPITHFKIQSSNKLGAWVVQSDHPKIEKDLLKLQAQWQRRVIEAELESNSAQQPNHRVLCSKILWQFVTTKQLQKDNVIIPARLPQSLQQRPSCSQHRSKSHSTDCNPVQMMLTHKQEDTRIHNIPNDSYRTSRKRRANSVEEDAQAKKVRKLCQDNDTALYKALTWFRKTSGLPYIATTASIQH